MVKEMLQHDEGGNCSLFLNQNYSRRFGVKCYRSVERNKQ